MASVAVLRVVLFLRMITVLTLAASVLVMGLNNYKEDNSKILFTELIAYRYVFATGAVGFVYAVIQIPFAIFNVVKEKRLIRNACLPEFDFFADQVIALLMASGVGVGFGVTFEAKRFFGDAFDNKANKYLDNANISTALLLVGVVFMVALTIISSNRRCSRKGFFK